MMKDEVSTPTEDPCRRQAMIRDEMENIYSTTPPGDIPWNLESPPRALVELVESGQLQPCNAIDLGCGAGNYAIYLASVGFSVTGVDVAPSAIALAQENAKKKGVSCNFLAANILDGLEGMSETFDFAYDWSLLHHIYPEDREKYVQTVHGLLAGSGKYLSVCFSEKDPTFSSSGKLRKTPLGTVLYFSSEEELRELFKPFFNMKTLETIEVEGKREPHLMNRAFMEKK